jgi:hypothetical protein
MSKTIKDDPPAGPYAVPLPGSYSEAVRALAWQAKGGHDVEAELESTLL